MATYEPEPGHHETAAVKFGVAFIPTMPSSEVVELARLAEQLGYDYLWIPDQRFHRDPFVLLGLCAQATRTIGLGVAVTNPFTRHPVQIARGAAAVDEVSQGRFTLGLGAGSRVRLLSPMGLRAPPTVPGIEECIDVCRRLFRGERISVDSETLSIREVSLDFPSRPDIPIYVGTRGPRILASAGAHADGVFLEAMFTPAALRYGVKQVAAGARAVGRAPADIRIVAWQSIWFTDEPASRDDAVFRNWAAMIIAGSRPDVLERMDVPPGVAEVTRADYRDYGESGAGRRIPLEIVGKVLLMGAPDEMADQIQAVAPLVDVFSVILLGDAQHVRRALRRLAQDVMPRFARGAAH